MSEKKVRVRRMSEKVRVGIDMDITGDWSADPLTVINGIAAGVKGMEPPLRAAVKLARQQGRTWEEIGKALGVSRQSAWERFSPD
ncbi:hypothetical protein EAS64_30700 [Trebonia kvetii]|uniref:Helix-turn-helix domain-containing protein n=1 Tax=Trebonia kvetii TaxID=2480626 RepID=A0A6P2BT26_9ACTN|nr:hypothetical protein [Trebonia kvetii]TVZ01817.1 hypothetical protein EAS64_30700 [Trebonia kvetii]